MQKKIIAAASVVFCLFGLARLAAAEEQTPKFRPFNGLFSDLFEDDGKTQPKQRPLRHNNSQDYSVQNYSTAGAQSQRAATKTQPSLPPAPGVEVSADPPPKIDRGPTTSGEAAGPSPRGDTGKDYSFQWKDSSPPSAPTAGETPIAKNQPATVTTAAAPPAALHERLKQFRQSPFGDEPDAATATPEAPSVARRDPPTGSTVAESKTALSASSPTRTSEAAPAASQPAPASSVAVQQPARGEPQPLPGSNNESNQDSVLINHKSPQLSVETIGPRKIVVGKEAAYEVVLQNSGDVAAEEVAVTVGLPGWAEVAGTSASTGDVQPPQAERTASCRWMLRRIEAHGKEKLTLRIVPKQSKPFELAVRWDFKQTPSQALIEVQEPRLAMRLDGPREVLFGKKELYRLMLSNSGNGPAENVALTLMPLTAGETQPITHKLGTLAAGDQRTIEVELTARQSGKIAIRVEANGDGGAHVELAENVLVHRGGMLVEIEGPAVQFIGTPAAYSVVVRNPGDATAKNIKITAKLPTGVKFVSGSDGAKANPATEGGRVQWTLERLEPGERRTLQMKCTLAVAGMNRLEIASAADDELAATAAAMTRVEATADLRLEVKELDGPVPVGAEAAYELHVRNRGTKAAENVEVLAYFSQGVEPISADGHAHHINPGEVVFDAIPAVAPGAELVLTIKAKGQLAGNHIFRAELHCKSAGTRLVREEMTRYYQDGPGQLQTATSRESSPREEQRTAERQAPLPLPQSSDRPMPARAINR